MRVRIARDELRRLRELTHASNVLEAEIADLVAQVAPQLLDEPGFGPLTAAKLVGEIVGGNRQINAAIHRVAVTRARCHPETIEFVARKKTEGKTRREAIRCLKRHLARRIWQLLRAPPPAPRNDATPINLLTKRAARRVAPTSGLPLLPGESDRRAQRAASPTCPSSVVLHVPRRGRPAYESAGQRVPTCNASRR
jgi:hypothetical protein